MSLPALTVIPAGAGSGKTYRIKEDLGAWVEQGLVAPQKIVAVTFTEAAAAELRDRIRRSLLDLDRLEDALLLDEAYISTIHSFGLRIITEFAFESCQSPQPRLLTEDEQDILIRQSLSRTEKAEPVLADLGGYGYKYDFMSGKSAADLFRDDVLGVVALLRSIGWQPDKPCDMAQVKAWIAERYGAVGNGKRVTKALRAAVDALLAAYPESLAGLVASGNATATKAFRQNYRDLRQAQIDGELEQNWALWQRLRELRLSKRGASVPEDYEELAQSVIHAADTLVTHPGPLAHAQAHIEALLGAGEEVLTHYAQAKAQAGLVDYTDMIVLADQLLQQHPDVLQALVQRIDCLVVDEFQDTNPQQFSLLWRLREAGVPALVVGDLKQAIMGFQGADPRLLEALIEQNKENAQPLTSNWRSQPALMEIINKIGPGLFGDAYRELQPQAPASALNPMEVIEFQTRPRKDSHTVRASWVGERVQQMLGDASLRVVDRRTGKLRGLEGRDIAILCHTHKTLARYADVLRAQGLKVRLEEDGWFGSRPVQLAFYALSYVANPGDRHAALYMSVTELGAATLEDGLRQLIAGGRVADPVLDALDVVRVGDPGRNVFTMVADTLAALALYDAAANWPDAAQARASLIRLQAEAEEFMNANRDARAAGGIHGEGLPSFLAWLAVKVTGKDNDRKPIPRVQDEDAIELVTWHASKGREWPIVIVGEMERPVKPRLPNLGLGYTSFHDLASLLEHARIEFSPNFAAPGAAERFSAALQSAAETEARRLLYVALTRSREKLILEWPSYAIGGKATTVIDLLTADCEVSLNGSELTIGQEHLKVEYLPGASELPADLDLNLDAGGGAAGLSPIGRRAIATDGQTVPTTPDSVSPSTLEKYDSLVVGAECLSFAPPLDIDGEFAGAEFGTMAHRFFELGAAPAELRERLAESLSQAGLPADLVAQLAQRVTAFEAWVSKKFLPLTIHRELPILALNEAGSVVSGLIDMVVETEAGCWVIDHKTDRVADPVEAFAGYGAQLASYRSALEKDGYKVLGTGIHWVRRGEVVLWSPPE